MRRGRAAPARLPYPGLGRLRPAGRHRNPSLRRRQHPGRPALARHAAKPDSNAAGRACRPPSPGAEAAATIGGALFPGAGRSGFGRGERLPGCGRQAGGQPGGPGGGTPMTVDQLINVLVTVTLIEMMVSIGLGVTFADLAGVARDWRLVTRAALANYVCVPAAAVGLLLLFGAHPMVAAGFLVLAVCPGAPYGPPFTAIAKGNVPVAVGLMVILAGSSAVVAPVLLHHLLLLVSGSEPLQVDAMRVLRTLLVSQVLPLCVGAAVRQWRPLLADRMQRPADLVCKVLNLVVLGLILVAQFRLLTEIQPRG